MKTRNVGGIGSVELNFTERVTVSRCCYCTAALGAGAAH
jgi:hypothetical protein